MAPRVRPATPDDVADIFDMIVELATYEKLDHLIRSSPADIARALFETNPVIADSIVEIDGQVAGHALWYRTFSTFLGRSGVWLEDLYIRPEFRRHGCARALLEHLRAMGSGRVEWEVLEDNELGLRFYDSIEGAEPFRGWIKYRWIPPDS